MANWNDLTEQERAISNARFDLAIAYLKDAAKNLDRACDEFEKCPDETRSELSGLIVNDLVKLRTLIHKIETGEI